MIKMKMKFLQNKNQEKVVEKLGFLLLLFCCYNLEAHASIRKQIKVVEADSFKDAEAKCENNHMTLVSSFGKEKREAMEQAITNEKASKNSCFFVGLQRKARSIVIESIGGKSYGYDVPFANNEPNKSPDEDTCYCVQNDGNNQQLVLMDEKCDKTASYLCQNKDKTESKDFHLRKRRQDNATEGTTAVINATSATTTTQPPTIGPSGPSSTHEHTPGSGDHGGHSGSGHGGTDGHGGSSTGVVIIILVIIVVVVGIFIFKKRQQKKGGATPAKGKKEAPKKGKPDAKAKGKDEEYSASKSDYEESNYYEEDA